MKYLILFSQDESRFAQESCLRKQMSQGKGKNWNKSRSNVKIFTKVHVLIIGSFL